MTKRILATLPGIGAALLPNATCPACWPVYAGILSSLGLSFLLTGPYFYVFVGVLLGISLFSLAFRAKKRRGYLPFWVGLSSAGAIIAGKYYLLSDYVFYAGVLLLIIASVWNNFPVGSSDSQKNNESVPTWPNCNNNPS